MSKTIPSQAQKLKRAHAIRWQRLLQDPTCTNCGQTKTPADFERKGVDYWCIACRRKYAAELYRKKIAAMTPAELKAYRDEVNRRQNARRKSAISAMTPRQLSAYRARINADNQKRRDEVRDQVYRAYGGYRCACCGETEPTFLSIDHINNDGSKHKREHRLHTGEQMYRWLVRNGYPAGFQILCMNCQWGKRNNNGVCPHKSGKA